MYHVGKALLLRILVFLEGPSFYGILCIHIPVLLAFLSYMALAASSPVVFLRRQIPTGSYGMVEALLVIT